MKELQKCLTKRYYIRIHNGKQMLICIFLSLGPAFVCFLGEKYGYRPFPARIPATYLDKMWKHVVTAELEYAKEQLKGQSVTWRSIQMLVETSHNGSV